ncbi:MAG TPA: hypothetical protein VN958_12235 [Chitinophagaceae bacterium]|nr:hypothetical protein [Chitinophagaceae bacterium]
MNYDYQQTDLSRSILAGLFAGIIATVANLIFIFIYRRLTAVNTFNLMDVFTTIFGTVLLLILCGLLFYFFVHYLKRGINIYRVIVFLVTATIIYVALQYHSEAGYSITSEFRILFIGTQLIIGGFAAFVIPYVFRHDSIIS